MNQLWHELRHVLRPLRTTPGLSALIVSMLAVGIGAVTVIFSAVSALRFRPLPVPRADRLVYGIALREGFDPFGTSLLDYSIFRDNVPEIALSGVAAQRAVNLVTHGEPERVAGVDVSATYLSTMQIEPLIGRRFNPSDDRPGAPPTVLIGYDLWRRRFAARPDIVGQMLETDESVWTIVGVMPRGFDLPAHAEVWMPARLDIEALPMEARIAHNWAMVARLRDGFRMDQANASFHSLAARIEREFPQYRHGWTYQVIPLRRELMADIDGRSERGLAVLFGAVGLLLLICCANVAALLLVRGIARQREIVVRLALGCGRGRIVRQLLTESAVFACLGGLAGLLLASWTAPLIADLNPIHATALANFLTDFSIDARVLTFTVIVATLSAGLFGVVPTLSTLRASDVATALRRGENRTVVDVGGRRWLNAMVITEVAVATTLLVSGSLLVQSFQRLRQVDLGFRPERVLTMRMALAPAKYPRDRDRAAFVERLLERVRALPGVESAGVSTNLPLDDLSFDSVFTVEGQPRRDPSEIPITAHRLVTAGYLEALGVRLQRGRLLEARDRAESTPVVVISQEFSRRAWPNDSNPIGRRVRRGSADQSGFPWLTVVGVIADTKEDQFNFRINRPAWYLPYSQGTSSAPVSVALRTNGDPVALEASIRGALQSIDPTQAIERMRLMNDQVGVVLQRDRFSAVLVAVLAVVGMAFAACGLYGVIAYAVGQRRGELGLRLALGATPTDLILISLGHGASLVATGLTLGFLVALGLTRSLSGLLYEVGPHDLRTFALVALVLGAVGLLACCMPARRASAVDPAVALRGE